MASLVTDRAHVPSDAGRERLRLWAEQRMFAAAWAASAIGTAWLAVRLGGGAIGAAAVVAAGLAPVALGAPGAARMAAGVAAAIACAALVGAARAAFDAATTDVLQHLTDADRRCDACRDLTARLGAGHAAAAGAAV